MFVGPMSESLLGRAQNRGVIDIRIHNLRDWSEDKRHRKIDDRAFGGGPGMVIQAEPIDQALQAISAYGAKFFGKNGKPHVIYLSPQGPVLTQKKAGVLSKRPWIVLLCGHYEGIDERAMRLIDEEISIGDYVLTGGELPAMVLADTVARLVPGVVKEPGSLAEESFQEERLDYPQYTRPAVWKGRKVPDVLLSGDHAAIRKWRLEQADLATRRKRPDLIRSKLVRRKR
jgi:tRNA (guanine37-N1)-methyltransferase